MTTPLFEKLRQQAWDREHPIIIHIQDMWNQPGFDGPFFPRDVPMLGRLASSLQDEWLKFQREISTIAAKQRMRVQNWPVFCPHCNQESCPGAVPQHPMQFLSPAQLMAMMLGGPDPKGGT